MTAPIILLVISIFELGLLVIAYTRRTQPVQLRSGIYLVEFAVLIGLFASGLLQWSILWLGLLVLLTVQALIGGWRLLHGAALRDGFRFWKDAGLTVVRLLLFLLAIAPALFFPPYELPAITGHHLVTFHKETYTDPDRIETYRDSGENRTVNVVFWYPADTDPGAKFPLVVFSHGGLGLETSNESLYQELASHGYVVCAIGHPYHALWTKESGERLVLVSQRYSEELQQEDPRRDIEQSYRYYQEWMAIRMADINLVLDTILEKADINVGGVYQQVDGDHIGVMGHSLGGSAALGMPRQREDIGAVIALESPYLADILGVSDGQFVWNDLPYQTPVMHIYSDSAWPHLGEWLQYERNEVALGDAGVVSIHLPGAGHFSLTDLGLSSPLLVQWLEGGKPRVEPVSYLQTVNKICLEFLDKHLK